MEAYAATNDLSAAGLQAALEQAERSAERIARHVPCSTSAIAAGASSVSLAEPGRPFPRRARAQLLARGVRCCAAR